MNFHEAKFYNRYIDIPEEFHSCATGKPFRHCKVCGTELVDSGKHYIIEKAVRKYTGYKAWDVIFEYAICLDCIDNLRNELSQDSLKKINEYFENHTDFFRRRAQLLEQHLQPTVEDWTSHCIVKGIPIAELEEYQIYGECIGDKFVFSHLPYMVSGQALDEIANLLSNETLDQLERFSNQYLTPSPDLEDIVPGPKIILV